MRFRASSSTVDLSLLGFLFRPVPCVPMSSRFQSNYAILHWSKSYANNPTRKGVEAKISLLRIGKHMLLTRRRADREGRPFFTAHADCMGHCDTSVFRLLPVFVISVQAQLATLLQVLVNHCSYSNDLNYSVAESGNIYYTCASCDP